ncbi:MAG: monofunctional biosynthetic peptidoglycan transglycosylase [Myxococcales bacterium]
MLKRTRKTVGQAALLAVALLCLAAGLFFLTLPSAEPLRIENPRTTALMEARAEQAAEYGRSARRSQQWMPMARISPWLRRAVVNSEDARFYEHDGFDIVETEAALELAAERGRLGRGASTITQQLAKNLWLGEERTLWRKLREYFLARRLEELGKRRVLELYLNVAEWGEGVYGAEAAARTWFNKPAIDLSPEESSVLAAMLPAPRHRNPQRPNARLRKRAFEILALYGIYQQLTPEQLADSRARLTDMLGTSEVAAER